MREPRLSDYPPFDKAEPLPDSIWIWDRWGFASFPPVWREFKAGLRDWLMRH